MLLALLYIAVHPEDRSGGVIMKIPYFVFH